MNACRILLVTMLLALVAYTGVVISEHGIGLIPVFFGDIKSMNWPGQFNTDFLGFLILSALWTTWRNDFKAKGFLLAPLALFGGMLFLTVYLLYESYRAKADMRILLLGNRRAA